MALLPEDPAQQRKLLIGVVPLLLLFAYWYFPHTKWQDELTASQARLETLEGLNSRSRMMASRSKQLEERLSKFERHVGRLEQLVPRGEQVNELLNTIHERARQMGVEVALFNPGSREVGTHYNRQTYNFVMIGPYHNVAQVLAEIGSLPRIVTPINLSISPSRMQNRRGEGQLLEAAFTVETYVIPEPTARPAQPAQGQGGGGE